MAGEAVLDPLHHRRDGGNLHVIRLLAHTHVDQDLRIRDERRRELDRPARLELTAQVGLKLQFIGDAPVVKASAKTGRGVGRLLPVLADAIERYHRRVPTRDVNKVLAAAQERHPAPHGARVVYALQGAAEPPTFTLFVNKELPQTYLRYLENQLRILPATVSRRGA